MIDRLLRMIRSHGYDIGRFPRGLANRPDAVLKLTLDYVIAHRLSTDEADPFVVQVGAFDGVTDDPLHYWIKRFGWRGILVEPQGAYFERLRATYGGCPGIQLMNVAVAEISGHRPFYYIPEGIDGVPEWCGQLASFDLETILTHSHLFPELKEVVESTQIRCLTFEDLLLDVDRVDLLQIDAEGYDAEILRLFDFDRWRPSIIHFEHSHLSKDAQAQTNQRLIGYGYSIAQVGGDTIGYLVS